MAQKNLLMGVFGCGSSVSFRPWEKARDSEALGEAEEARYSDVWVCAGCAKAAYSKLQVRSPV